MKLRVLSTVVKIQPHEVYKLWWGDLPNDKLAESLGLTRGQLWALAKRLKLPKRPKHLRAWTVNNGLTKDDPTPQEITERAAAIRAGWPDGEAEKRMVGRRSQRYEMPAFRCIANTAGRNVSFVRANHEF